MKLEYYTNVNEAGEMQRSTAAKIKHEVTHFAGKRIQITIERLKVKRSDRQNRLWWAYMNLLSNELGYDKDEMHEICKFKFLKREKVCEITGEIFEYLGSTAKLTKIEFAEVTSQLIRWSAETFKIILPQPGEQWEIILE